MTNECTSGMGNVLCREELCISSPELSPGSRQAWEAVAICSGMAMRGRKVQGGVSVSQDRAETL